MFNKIEQNDSIYSIVGILKNISSKYFMFTC